MYIIEAMRQSNPQLLREALNEHRGDVFSNAFGSWMHRAAMDGLVEHMEVLSEFGLSADQKSPWSDHWPIDSACGAGQIEAVRWLLAHGANPNQGALVSAVIGKSLECVKLLIEAGADPRKASGKPPRTAYQQAIMLGQSEIAEFLKQFDAVRPLDVVAHLQGLFGPVDDAFPKIEAPWQLKVFGNTEVAVICTVGLSNFQPPGLPYRAELALRIPRAWLMPAQWVTRPAWPLEYLMDIASAAAEAPCLANLATVGNGEPPLPLASDVKYCGALFLTEDSDVCPVFADGTELRVFSLQPLSREEISLARKDVEALVRGFERIGMDPTDPVSLDRPNAAKRFRFW